MNLGTLLQAMTLTEYIEMFGRLWHPENKEITAFNLWPSQKDMCDKIEMWHRQGFLETIHPKARQGGFSEIFAERAIKHNIQYNKAEGCIFSKSGDDAEYFLDTRIRRKLINLPKIEGVTWPKITRDKKTFIELSNGSKFQSFAATSAAGAGHTGDWGIFDECGGIDKQHGASFAEMYKNYVPVVEKAGKIAWIAQIGTSEPGTYYNQKAKNVWLGKDTETKLYFIGWKGDPSRGGDWYNKKRMKMESDADMKTQYPETIDDFFTVKEGLIFPSFDPTLNGRHVKEFDLDKFDMAEGYYITGYDHGFIHPAVYLCAYYDKYRDHLYLWSERYWTQVEVPGIGTDILGINARLGRPIKRSIADAAIFNRTGVVTISDTFKKMGVRFTPSEKTRGLVGEDGSRVMLSKRFTDGKITIHPRCMELREQLSTWKWKAGVNIEKPEETGDDGPDVLRYLCAEIRRENPPPGPTELELLQTQYGISAKEAERMVRKTGGGVNPDFYGNQDSDQDSGWMNAY